VQTAASRCCAVNTADTFTKEGNRLLSYVAFRYVKKLVQAPDGSRITPTEKVVLLQLADDHNEEAGIAFPSMKNLAKRCCLSERGCRKVILSLVRKGVIRRIHMRRKNGGGQSSNDYQFVGLDNPQVTPKQAEARRRLQRTPRIPMCKSTGGPGRKVPPITECGFRGSMTNGTGVPGTRVPPIEHLGDLLSELASKVLPEGFPPTPHGKAWGMQDTDTIVADEEPKLLPTLQLMRIGWTAAVESVHGALMASAPRKLESRPGYRNGYQDWQEYSFDDLVAESMERVASGILLRVSSPDPAASQAGLQKYKARWDKALNAAFGCDVEVRLQPNDSRGMGGQNP
jgi:Helix-turn-helix domain